MKTITALFATSVFFSIWPQQISNANPAMEIIDLQVCIRELRQRADSQSIINMDKMQLLKIKTTQAKLLRLEILRNK